MCMGVHNALRSLNECNVTQWPKSAESLLKVYGYDIVLS